MGGLQASATVRWSGWGGTISPGTGTFEAETSTQRELGGPGAGTNPEELFAAAHANCLTSTLTSLARARKVDLAEVETSATARLAWSDGHGDHRLAESDLRLRIRSADDPDRVRALVREAADHCPVCRAIAGNVTMNVDVEVLPAGA